jgi:hypothetical protein
VPNPACYRLGIVSNTHGLLRTALVETFAGVDRAIHTGDVNGEKLTPCFVELGR